MDSNEQIRKGLSVTNQKMNFQKNPSCANRTKNVYLR